MAKMTEEIEEALSKISDYDKKILGLDKKFAKKQRSFYNFIMYYTIGDSDGERVDENKVSCDNYLADELATALGKLVQTPEYNSVHLGEHTYEYNLSKKIITQREYDLIMMVGEHTFDWSSFLNKYNIEQSDKVKKFISELYYIMLLDEDDCGWLSFDGCNLK